VLGANNFGGILRPLRTLIVPSSCRLVGLNECAASNTSAPMIAACVRKETPCARPACA
jgi:hypothetical protein